MSEEEKKDTPAEGAEESKEETKEVEVPEKFKKLVEEIEQMSVLDLAELVSVLEDKFGVSAAAPMMMAGAMPGAGGEEAAEEKSSYDVELAGIGDNKIAVIKAVKDVAGLGLKEAKDMVDGAPCVIAEGVKTEDAEEMKAKLTEAGAEVNLK